MTKIVYNACYGGFGLSEQAVARYAELKGLTLYPETNHYGLVTYWLVPPDQRTGFLSDEAFKAEDDFEKRAASNRRYAELTLTPREIPRTDPALVQVVEEMGDLASGKYGHLRIEEVPEGTRYRIDEYDGNERVMTIDDYDWSVA